MKTIEVNLFKFEELSEESQQRTLEKLWDINLDDDWWEWTYEDAENVGIKITSFDEHNITGELLAYCIDIAKNIINEHGENCNTYKTATEYLPLLTDEWNEDYEGEPIAEDFKQSILEDYRIMLNKEYEYLTSEEAIIETFEANEYTFEEDGTMNNSI